LQVGLRRLILLCLFSAHCCAPLSTRAIAHILEVEVRACSGENVCNLVRARWCSALRWKQTASTRRLLQVASSWTDESSLNG
jgi:hypothetical protein